MNPGRHVERGTLAPASPQWLPPGEGQVAVGPGLVDGDGLTLQGVEPHLNQQLLSSQSYLTPASFITQTILLAHSPLTLISVIPHSHLIHNSNHTPTSLSPHSHLSHTSLSAHSFIIPKSLLPHSFKASLWSHVPRTH